MCLEVFDVSKTFQLKKQNIKNFEFIKIAAPRACLKKQNDFMYDLFKDKKTSTLQNREGMMKDDDIIILSMFDTKTKAILIQEGDGEKSDF